MHSFIVLALLRLGTASANPADDRASFVTTLGRDTVALESVVYGATHVTGDLIVRVPGTVRFHYDVELRPDGTVARTTVELDPMGAKDVVARKVVADFGADSVTMSIDSAGQHRKLARAIAKGTMPTFMTGFGSSYGLYNSMAMYELILAHAKPGATDTLIVPSVDASSGAASKRKFVGRGAGKIDVDYFGILWTHLTTDANGRIATADARETTEQTQTQRVAYFDVGSLAKSFASADHSGKGVGVASPSKTAQGKLGGELVVVSYSSPRRRGRTILGDVVPFDHVWRTGANSATVLICDHALKIGGAAVPAGSYSLWTIPKQDGTVQLVINRQHGQWGTEYDPDQDLVRVPMKTSIASTPQENFTIDIAGSGSAGELRISWDTLVWSVPMEAA